MSNNVKFFLVRSALIVRGNQLEVLGEGRVAIYDNQKHGGNWYYWLKAGDKFDLHSRKAKTE